MVACFSLCCAYFWNIPHSNADTAMVVPQPRTLRFTFSRTNTSSKHPKLILFELERVLALHGITYQQQEAFLLVCVQGPLQFEMEVGGCGGLRLHVCLVLCVCMGVGMHVSNDPFRNVHPPCASRHRSANCRGYRCTALSTDAFRENLSGTRMYAPKY